MSACPFCTSAPQSHVVTRCHDNCRIFGTDKDFLDYETDLDARRAAGKLGIEESAPDVNPDDEPAVPSAVSVPPPLSAADTNAASGATIDDGGSRSGTRKRRTLAA